MAGFGDSVVKRHSIDWLITIFAQTMPFRGVYPEFTLSIFSKPYVSTGIYMLIGDEPPRTNFRELVAKGSRMV